MSEKKLKDIIKDAQHGDKTSIEFIINKYKNYVLKMASRTYIKDYDMNDLIQEGYLSIINSINKFDLNKSYNFTNYVTNAIRQNYYYKIREKAKLNYESSLDKCSDSCTDMYSFIPSNFNLEEYIIKKENYSNLINALNKLDPFEKEFIIYIFVKKGTMKNFCLIKNINYKSCSLWKKKILKKLYNFIKETNPFDNT